MKEEISYEEAMTQLEQIVEQIENNELGIDELTSKLKQAQRLLKMCKDKLTKTDKEIEKLLGKE
ncbi:MAG: exodeoxyribonuclease VII small subunit [Prevotella sp.]|nr:exodeoxyribonuclease VII small subunit [Prevotella sp.]